MINKSNAIRAKALQRLSNIFKVDESELSDDIDMTVAFKPSFLSFFKRNEFDMVLDDIRDAASNKLITKLDNGEVVIITVRDYVDFMCACYQSDSKLVELVLGDI